MKLTNLSLAIMVAVGVAACGGSGDDNSNKPADPPKNNNQGQNDNKQPTPPAAEPHVVDPTGTQVVDDKDLTKQNTVGTLQYVRREDSQYDRVNNPSKPASASPLLGVTLNDQNPSLTNIVLARQNLTRADGVAVKAQFAGSDNPIPVGLDGTANLDSVKNGKSLQEENFGNVDVLAGLYQVGANNADGKHLDDGTTANVANNVDAKTGKIKRLAVDKANVYQYGKVDRTTGKRVAPTPVAAVTADTAATGQHTNLTASTGADLSAIIDPVQWQEKDGGIKRTGKDIDGKDLYVYRGDTAAGPANPVAKTVVTLADAKTKGARYGDQLVWWTAPETAFENEFTRTGKALTAAELTAALAPDKPASLADSAAATNGLVRVGGGLSTLGQELNWNKDENKWEDHHNTTTRIFGRYHLAYADSAADSKVKGAKPVALNSFKGAKSFIAEYETGKPTKATQYSLGAEPMTLQNVQYGRVTTNLDVDAGDAGYPDGFIRSPYKNKNDSTAVDNYFYRGTNATTIEQMAALPSDQTATYHGHALMYGIDNSFHSGGARNLPNAFAGATDGLGLGNFVEAQANFGTKRMIGKVYNEWLLDASKAATTRDNLVQFQGTITGNTVVGTADRTYIAGDDNATFKASFFGEKAEELGGSFNSVKDADKYGDAYGSGDWGGVFGASKGAATSNTFQGDDGANNYGSL
ncbi:transferrin-binding protein-like solute binding protein [Cardiobacterium hominis]|uniref:transferrin-binding protein-like solute binding protein n=1 Tax=Cardiobacterium hominis TaxID=2718 RepID=UPI0028E36334|nr:transferrin-binding protein-like solute binding protein [Cardiobacterium hominis]